MKTKLDTAANIAIIVLCVVAVAAIVKKVFLPPAAPPAPAAVVAAEAGDVLAGLGSQVPAGADRALFVALSPDCRYCAESMPFYRRLTDTDVQVPLVAAVPSPAAAEREQAVLAEAGVAVDAVTQVDFAAAKIPGTPTLLLVDRRGRVERVWVGKLAADGEAEVLAAVGAG